MFRANAPMVFSGIAASAYLVITAMPSGPGAGLVALPNAPLVANDATTLAGSNSGNQILSLPLSAMFVGMSVSLGTTSTGLAISAVPPGVGYDVTLGSV